MKKPATSSPKVKHKHDACHYYLKENKPQKKNILMHEQTRELFI